MNPDNEYRHEYRVVTKFGCKIIFGNIQPDDLAAFCAPEARKDWIIDVLLANRIGATMVAGPPDAIKSFSESNPTPSKKRQAEARNAKNSGIPESVTNWLLNGHRGASSEALCKHFFEVPVEANVYCYPLDPSDLNRCLKFLDAAFGTRNPVQINSVRSLGPVWSAYVDRWVEIITVFGKEVQTGVAMETYDLMQKIQDEVRHQSNKNRTNKQNHAN